MIQSLFIFNYSLPNESLELNGDDFPLHVWSTEVDVRNSDDVKTGENGISSGNTWYGKRTFHMEGDILASNSAEYITKRRHLLRILTPKSHLGPNTPFGVMDITFDGMSEKVQAEFTLDSYPEIPMEALSPSYGHFQINLRAPDPRLYTVEKSVNLQPQTTVGYRAYPKTYSYTYSIQTFSGWLNFFLTNSGDIETYPRFVINGPVLDGILTVTRNGVDRSLFFTGLTILAGETLEVNFAKRTAVKNSGGGQQNVYSYAVGDWWTIEPGENLITLYYRTGSDTVNNPSATFNWKNAYVF